MSNQNTKFSGIKQLSRDFAITMMQANKALKVGKIMSATGEPVKPEYAVLRPLSDGTPRYVWNEKVAYKAFIKAGHPAPSELDHYSHVQNKHQAESRIDDAFQKMGEIAKLDELYDTSPGVVEAIYEVYQGAVYSDNHAIGGPCAVRILNSKEACATFINRFHRVVDDYEAGCKAVCVNAKQIERIEFYAAALRRLGAWVQLQFFR
ncbi:hypothetical protein [Pseudomonas sp. S1(2024)]|uniref:hypothetical protein n=1 Tax=Pseudomonas sp. S1(2024) TaxID=3390191 RepID=UPI003979ACB6